MRGKKQHPRHKKGKMKVAPKVIFLLNGGDGFSSSISGNLHPNPNSNLQKINDSFELSLERYGIKDQKAAGKLLHFVNARGLFEVSILILENCEPPILACALNEVLLQLAESDLSKPPTLIVPFIVPEFKLKQDNKSLAVSDTVSVYGIKLGPTTDLTQTLSSKLQNLPPSLKIYHEDLSLLLHLVNITKLPTIALIGQKSSNEELQVIQHIGEHLASVLPLSFSKEKIAQNPTKISKDSKEAWRALYG